EELGALALRHPGRGLVEEEHAWARREGERDLDEALLAVGELASGAVPGPGKAQALEDAVCFLDRRLESGQGAPPVMRVALALEHGERHGLERGEPGKERVDLKGARQPGAHARLGPQAADVSAAERNRAAVGPQHAGQQV